MAATAQSTRCQSMPLLANLSNIILHIEAKQHEGEQLEKHLHKLKFVKYSMQSLADIEENLADYLEAFADNKLNYDQLLGHIKNLTDESRVCELLAQLIRTIEHQLDQQEELFDDVIAILKESTQMESEDDFQVQVVVKSSLLVYDSFIVLRSMRQKVMQIAAIYHVPYFYDTEEVTFRLRGSLLTTFKNIGQVMADFSILSKALWYVRTVTTVANPVQPDSQAEQVQPEMSDNSSYNAAGVANQRTVA